MRIPIMFLIVIFSPLLVLFQNDKNKLLLNTKYLTNNILLLLLLAGSYLISRLSAGIFFEVLSTAISSEIGGNTTVISGIFVAVEIIYWLIIYLTNKINNNNFLAQISIYATEILLVSAVATFITFLANYILTFVNYL